MASPLDDLERRLQEARARQGAGPGDAGAEAAERKDDAAGRGWVGLAFRIGVEMTSAVVVGVGIGLAFDFWLGTSPAGLIVFFLLGSAAAILNAYRAATGAAGPQGRRSPLGSASSHGRDETLAEGRDDRGRSA